MLWQRQVNARHPALPKGKTPEQINAATVLLVFEDRVVDGVSSLHKDGRVPFLGPLFGDGVRTLPDIGPLEEDRGVDRNIQCFQSARLGQADPPCNLETTYRM